jgi:hypothetical protein
MAGLNCVNDSNNSLPAKFNITNECALFDYCIYTVICGLFCAVGVAGNVVSFTILWNDSTKTATAFLLRALAVADTLVLLTVIPLYVLEFVYPYNGQLKSYYDMYSIIMPYLWPCYQISYTGTILLTVLVSLNRYFCVCRPFKSADLVSLPQARRHVCYVAVFAIFYNIPRFFEYETVEECVGYNESITAFELSAFGDNKLYRVIYANVMYFVVLLGGPLIALAFLNVKLIIALKKRQRKRAEMGKSSDGMQQDLTLVLVVVICSFMVCQTPTFIDHILWTVVHDSQRMCGRWHYYYTAIGDMMSIFNSSVNFFIYVMTSRKFRESLIVPCLKHGQDFMRLPTGLAEMTVATQTPDHHNHVNKPTTTTALLGAPNNH